ncbi:polysaccharide deacetylase family protein [Antarctobacter sp.]|uniref:polysaccharide deacetylase family protein n=1 Tax=Antarctobacter sp. TaxID=1872577 RepID=UPI002B26F991|nr:polysaccharide deacetylase family protein [Antarctobacter sp.]
MMIAFTMDDLPLWPQSYPPVGYTAAGIVDAIRAALADHRITGVYAFCNSWPLDKHPEFAAILDDWVADGHHVANHTHGHIELPDVTAEAFIADIDLAEARLAPWLSKAPRQLFRHPLCHWGETADKLARVNAHLKKRGLTPVDVHSWAFEWTWNRAYRNALDARDTEAQTFVRESFLDFSVAQLRHDMAAAEAWFGAPQIGITLGHNVPFFADIASAYFARLKSEGVEFVPLEEALTGPAQTAVGSVVSGEFLVLHQKLAAAAGQPLPRFPADMVALHARIVEMAVGQTG